MTLQVYAWVIFLQAINYYILNLVCHTTYGLIYNVSTSTAMFTCTICTPTWWQTWVHCLNFLLINIVSWKSSVASTCAYACSIVVFVGNAVIYTMPWIDFILGLPQFFFVCMPSACLMHAHQLVGSICT